MDERDYKAMNKQQNGNDFIADVSPRLEPNNLVIKGGCHIMRLDMYNDFRNKPTVRLTCIDDDTDTIDLDGDWIEESTEGCFLLNSENIDVLIDKLKEAKNFLNVC